MNGINKILVTGGCGFLGQHLVQQLIGAFPTANISVIDLKGSRDLFKSPRVSTHLGLDITAYDTIGDIFAGCDIVIHCAGLVSFSLKDRDILHRVAIVGTQNVLKASHRHKVSKFIHISSVAALGYNDDPACPVDETFTFDWEIAQKRKKYYMLSKYYADAEVKAYMQNGLPAVIVYPGLMLGPGDLLNTPKLIEAIARRRLLFNPSGGTNVIDVRDVAHGIRAVIDNFAPSETYLLSGENLSFKEMHSTIAQLLSVSPPMVTLPRQSASLLYWTALLVESLARKRLRLTADNLDSAFKFRYFNNAKARHCIGWSPTIPFQTTILDTIAWMQNGSKR